MYTARYLNTGISPRRKHSTVHTIRKNLVLPEINDEQGPLMHMPLTGNPDEFTNSVTRFYYNKDRVIAVPRSVWDEMHGMDKK